MPDTEQPRQTENEAGGGISRRQMLRRSLVAGGSAALMWSTPAVASVKLAQEPPGTPLTTVGGGGQTRNGGRNGGPNGGPTSVLGGRFNRGQGGGLPFTGLSLAELLAAGMGATAAGAGAASYDKVRKKRKARKIRKARAAAAAAAEKAISEEVETPDE